MKRLTIRALIELAFALVALVVMRHVYDLGIEKGRDQAPTVEPAACPCVCPCVVRFGPSAWDCSGAVEWMPAEAKEGR